MDKFLWQFNSFSNFFFLKKWFAFRQPYLHFLFENLWKKSLRRPYRLAAVWSWEVGWLLLSRESRNTAEGTWNWSTACCLWFRSHKFGSWNSRFTLKFLLGHNFCNCSLLLLCHLFKVSVEVEEVWPLAGADGRWGHAGADLPKQRPIQRTIEWTPLPMCCMATSTGHRVCFIHSNVGQVKSDGPGISNHQNLQFAEGCLDLVSEDSRREAASNRSGSPWLQQTSAQPAGQSSWRIWHDLSRTFKGSNGMSCQQKLLPGSPQIGSQGWCHLSGFLLQEIWRHSPSSFVGHEGLWTLWKFPIKLGQQPRKMLWTPFWVVRKGQQIV